MNNPIHIAERVAHPGPRGGGLARSVSTRAAPVLVLLFTLADSALSQSSRELDGIVFEPALPGGVVDHDGPPRILDYVERTAESAPLLGELSIADLQRLMPEAPRAGDVLPGDIGRYRDRIADIETQDGAFAPELFESLLSLGILHQEEGDHEQAIAVFERAEHISRVNNGLFSPEQFPIIEQIIESYLALGQVREANEKQQYLVFLGEEHYGTSNMQNLPSLINLADLNMSSFNRAISAPIQPSFSFTSGAGPFSQRQPNPREMAFFSLFQAQRNYYKAILTMHDNAEYFHPLLLDLEYRLLETLFYQAFRPVMISEPHYYLSEERHVTGSLISRRFLFRNSMGYASGKDAFERILIYLGSNPDTRLSEYISALVEYGDWHMLFGRAATAAAKYREAIDMMRDLGIDQADIDSIFAPALPVQLPLVTAKPNSREKFGIPTDQDLAYDGYIDIAFTISRYGRATQFEVTGRSDNATRQIERRLKKYLRNSPFRPRFRSGEADRATPERVSLRYYYVFPPEHLTTLTAG